MSTHLNIDIYEDKLDIEYIYDELKRTYEYLTESDMDSNDEGDKRHLKAVENALDFIEEIKSEIDEDEEEDEDD